MTASRRARELRTELERMDEELKEFAPFVNAEDKRALVSEVRTEGERLRMQQSHLESDLEAVSMEKPVQWPTILGLIMLVMGAVLIPLVKPYLVGIVVAVAGIILLAYGIDRLLGWRRQLRLAQANMLKGEVSIRKNERALQNALSQFGFQDYDEYVRQLGKCDRQIDRRNETAHKLERHHRRPRLVCLRTGEQGPGPADQCQAERTQGTARFQDGPSATAGTGS